MIKTEDTGRGSIQFALGIAKLGDLTITLGGADSEFVYVSADFNWRGRTYPGQVTLKRGSLEPDYAYTWQLKTANGSTASWAVRKGVADAVSAQVRQFLALYPEIEEAANRASLADKLAQATKEADRLAEQLAEARQREDDLREQLAACGTCDAVGTHSTLCDARLSGHDLATLASAGDEAALVAWRARQTIRKPVKSS